MSYHHRILYSVFSSSFQSHVTGVHVDQPGRTEWLYPIPTQHQLLISYGSFLYYELNAIIITSN